ncbi:MAG: hypothetical protein VXY93_16175, partial [Pseudomonadota bacterium]|nr:hypothetical protein [Pseudomonadota bacterium]
MGSTSLRIAPGKVGVNEVTPLADFHVNQNEAHSSTYYLDSDAGVLIENINAAASRKSVLKLIGDSAIVYGGSGNGTLIFAQRQKETASFDANGNFSVNYDLDVDGHTNLDNVSIAGVVTATTFNGAL